MSKDDRYQYQPWYIKAYRWIRWVPYYYVLGTLKYIKYKNTTPDLEEDLSYHTTMKIWKGLAQCKMKHWYSIDEVRDNIEKRLEHEDR